MKFLPHVPQVKVRSTTCLSCALRWRRVRKPFLAMGARIAFLPSLDLLMGCWITRTSKCFPAGFAAMLSSGLFQWWLPVTRVNVLQLVIT